MGIELLWKPSTYWGSGRPGLVKDLVMEYELVRRWRNAGIKFSYSLPQKPKCFMPRARVVYS